MASGERAGAFATLSVTTLDARQLRQQYRLEAPPFRGTRFDQPIESAVEAPHDGVVLSGGLRFVLLTLCNLEHAAQTEYGVGPRALEIARAADALDGGEDLAEHGLVQSDFGHGRCHAGRSAR